MQLLAYPNGPIEGRSAYTNVPRAPPQQQPAGLGFQRAGSWSNQIIVAHRAVLAGRRPNLQGFGPFPVQLGVLRGYNAAWIGGLPNQMSAFEAMGTYLALQTPIDILDASRELINDWSQPQQGVVTQGMLQLTDLGREIYEHLYANARRGVANFMVTMYHNQLTFQRMAFNVFGPAFRNRTVMDMLYVRLSLDPNIAEIESNYIALALAIKVNKWVDEYHIEPQHQEEFGHVTGVVVHEYLPGNFSAFSHVIRGGSHKIIQMALGSPSKDVVISFKQVLKYMDARGLKLTSPKTRRNCLVQALLLASSERAFEGLEPKERHALQSQATSIMHKCPASRCAMDILLKVGNSPAFNKSHITVRNHFLECVGFAGNPKGKMVDVMIFAGHAYAMVPKTSNEEDEFELIERPARRLKEVVVGTWDTETTVEVVPYMSGYAIGSVNEVFTGFSCISDMLTSLCMRAEQDIVLYAHNGGKFDTYFLFGEMEHRTDLYMRAPLVEKNGRILSLVLGRRHGPGTITFRDTSPLMKGRLRELGEQYKVETQKGEMDYSTVTNATWRAEIERQDIRSYFIADLRCLYEVLSRWRDICISEFGMDPVALGMLTSPGITRELFWRTYKPNLYPLYTVPGSINMVAREAFHGGLVQVLQRGTFAGRIYLYDVVSLYPWVCSWLPLPYGIPDHTATPGGGDVGLFKIRVCGGDSKINVFMVKTAYNGLIDPRFSEPTELWVWSSEYYFARDNNDFFHYTELKVVDAYVFKAHPFLSELTMTLFERKKRCAKGTRQYEQVKEQVNCLWGFFGIRDSAKGVRLLAGKRELSALMAVGRLEDYRYPFAYGTFDIEASLRSVPVACAVTAEARVTILRDLVGLFKAGYYPIYTDTDSIMTFAPPGVMAQIHPVGSELGQMAVEYTATHAAVVAPKIKAMLDCEGLTEPNTCTWKITAKGLGIAALDFADIVGLLDGSPITESRFQFNVSKRHIVTGEAKITSCTRAKTVRGEFRKGHIGSDGRKVTFIARKVGEEWILT